DFSFFFLCFASFSRSRRIDDTKKICIVAVITLRNLPILLISRVSLDRITK
ncbi:unnamed protein product, partial [Arabidopsis halleri]